MAQQKTTKARKAAQPKPPATRSSAARTPTIEERVSKLEAAMAEIQQTITAATQQRQAILAQRLARDPQRLAELRAAIDAAQSMANNAAQQV